MGNLELLEQAFGMAESGEVSSVNEICESFEKNGVPAADLDQFRGTLLGQQLRQRIAKSRRKQPSVPFQTSKHRSKSSAPFPTGTPR